MLVLTKGINLIEYFFNNYKIFIRLRGPFNEVRDWPVDQIIGHTDNGKYWVDWEGFEGTKKYKP